MFPRTRLDALTDGIFSVAMTLLVLDVRLPEDFNPSDGAELLRGIAKLWPKILPYLLSFGVLGLRWISNLEVRSGSEYFNRKYVNWWLVYLLLITCVPFTTIVVGRFERFGPAIWLYAGHTFLIALISMRLIALTPNVEGGDRLRLRKMSAMLLAASSMLAIALSLATPRFALWALALNFVPAVLARLWPRRTLPD
jgi:uncharacterized membrane protein